MLFSQVFQYITKDSFKLVHIGIILISIIALLCAYYAEYVMNLKPCPLCVYQRFPYLYLIKLSAVALLMRRFSQKVLILIILTLFSACILAGYHTGIERKIFEPSGMCSSSINFSDDLAIDDIKKMFYNNPAPSCSTVTFKKLGLSMTEWNLILNFILLLFISTCYLFARK